MSETSSTLTLIPPQVSSTVLGDGLPSLHAIHYARVHATRNGVTNDFPAFSTTPQQDHLPLHSGIRIHASTDRRAQPWQRLVRANAHAVPLAKIEAAFPARDADLRQMREWIYLLLTREELGMADANPALVSLTVGRWQLDGKALRARTQGTWGGEADGGFLPLTWNSVWDEVFETSDEERARVRDAVEGVLGPLLRKEAEEREREELVRRQQKKSRVRSAVDGVGRLFCFGSKAKKPAEKASNATDEKVPRWPEKAIVDELDN